MPKISRNLPGNNVQDPASIHNLEYSDASGSKKVSEVGRHLLPIPKVVSNVVTYTTNVTTATAVDPGKCLAVYNNSGTVGSVTLGEDATVTSLAVGATDPNGHVGVPCMSNAWTYIAMSTQNWVIASAATLLVFLIDDNTTVRTEVK